MRSKIQNIPKTADIVVLPENTKGKDILVGDIHGNYECLMELIATIKEQDRLIIVGDLTDRGADSLAVVKLIIEYNQIRRHQGFPEIQVSRGNHENVFLDYYNGVNDNIFLEGMGGEWVANLTDDEKKLVADYYASLPYILHVPGANPFNVVHADMPITDDELLKRIGSNNFILTPEEIDHATWAREGDNIHILGKGRRATSIPTYCGHSIKQGLRISSNHINLDIGTYGNDTMCLVEHQTKKCKLFGNAAFQDPSVVAIKDDINLYFVFIEKLKEMVHIWNNPISLDKFEKTDELLSQYKSCGYDGEVLLVWVLATLNSDAQPSLQEYISQDPDSAKRVLTTVEEDNALDPKIKAKEIDKILIGMSHKYIRSGRDARLAYIMALSDVSHIFSKETNKALGDYLKTIKRHQLSETDHFSMFVPSEENRMRYINKALTILGVSHVAPGTIVPPEQGAHIPTIK